MCCFYSAVSSWFVLHIFWLSSVCLGSGCRLSPFKLSSILLHVVFCQVTHCLLFYFADISNWATKVSCTLCVLDHPLSWSGYAVMSIVELFLIIILYTVDNTSFQTKHKYLGQHFWFWCLIVCFFSCFDFCSFSSCSSLNFGLISFFVIP